MNYPTISEIKQMLAEGAFISVSYKGSSPKPKAWIIMYPSKSLRIKPSTVTYLENHGVIKYSHIRKDKNWVGYFFYKTDITEENLQKLKQM